MIKPEMPASHISKEVGAMPKILQNAKSLWSAFSLSSRNSAIWTLPLALCVGLGTSILKSASADYPISTQYSGDLFIDDVNDDIYIAEVDSESIEAKLLIEVLERFLRSNSRKEDSIWWLSKSGSISVVDEEDSTRAIIPNLKVVFITGKKETSLEIGDIELQFHSVSDDILHISVQFPSRVSLRNPDGSVAAELQMGSSNFALNWHSGLKTIIGYDFALHNMSLLLDNSPLAIVERIDGTAKLEDHSYDLWSGHLTLRIKNLDSSFLTIDELDTGRSVKNLQLRKFNAVVKDVDPDGRFGNWFFGGAFYPTEWYEHLISRENALPLIDAARSLLPFRGEGSDRLLLRDLSVPGYISITKIRYQRHDHTDIRGLGNFSMQASIEGIDVPTNGDNLIIEDLVPKNVNIDFNIADLPQVALVDILRAIVVDGLKVEWGNLSKQNVKNAALKLLFSHISEISMVLANAGTKISMSDAAIKAPSYVVRLKGEAIAEPSAKARFLGNLEFDVSNGNKTIDRFMDIAQSNESELFLSLFRRLKGSQKTRRGISHSSSEVYRLAVGYDGRIRLNETDLGSVLPKDTKFEFKSPKTARKIGAPTASMESDSEEIKSIVLRLRRLKALFEEGLIQKDEYDEKRREIIKSL